MKRFIKAHGARTALQTGSPGSLLGVVLFAFFSTASPAHLSAATDTGASAAACGTIYTVARGDTLFKIAERLYGNGDVYRRIFAANRDLLKSPAGIEIGDQLLIPCLDGSGPQTRAEVIPAGEATEQGGETGGDPVTESASAGPDTSAPEGQETEAGDIPGLIARPVGSVTRTADAAKGCGVLYTVVRGDTLQKISRRLYGTSKKYMRIFEANTDLLENPAGLEVGDQLLIPCLDGSGPQTRTALIAPAEETTAAAAPVAEAEETTDPDLESAVARIPEMKADASADIAPQFDTDAQFEMVAEPAEAPELAAAPALLAEPELSAATVRPVAEPLRLLTGSDFAPFAHRALPGGGMIPELVRLAVARAAPDRDVSVSFVDAWDDHLRLLEEGRYLLGFPWYRPDCDNAEALNPMLQKECSDFVFSEPLFEVTVAYYVRAGDPLGEARQQDDLFGMRLCRPAGHFTFDLDAAGLTAPSVERVTGADVAECFRDLVLGKVDVVTLDRSIAAREIARQRLAGRVTEVRGLATAQTLHVIAPKSNPEALAVLALIDEGLAELKFSGRWFDTVSRYVGLLNADIGWGAGAVWTPGNLSSAHFDGTPIEQGS